MTGGPVHDSLIAEVYLADHERLESLVMQLLAAVDADDQAVVDTAWLALGTSLSAHLAGEEAHVLPALISRSPRDARALIGEHRHLQARVAELRLAIDLRVVRVSMVHDFVHDLRAHALHEERVLYTWADRHLDAKEQLAMVEAIRRTAGGN